MPLRAKLIEAIHREYCEAGADVLTTNTFGANRVGLAKFGLADKVARDQLRRGRAGPASGRRCRPARAGGRLGRPLPAQPPYDGLVEEMIVEQVESLREGGADFIIFETQPTRAALVRGGRHAPPGRRALRALVRHRRAGRIGGGRAGRAHAGPLPDDCPPPVAWGMNCGSGPDGLLSAVERAVKAPTLPLVVQPNAGIPKEVEHRRIYFCSPEYLTEYAKRYVALGVSAVGGCCGTTPEHIREMARPIKPLSRPRVVPTAKPQRAGAGKAAGGLGRESPSWPPPGGAAVDHHRRAGAAARLRPRHDRGQEPHAPRARRRRRSTSPTARGRAPAFRR